MGPDWCNIDGWEATKGDMNKYELVDWLGAGKYSDVFTAYHEGDIVAIKILKPVRKEKYAREAKILMNLKDGPNIVSLLDILENPLNQNYSLVFENINDTDYQSLLQTMSPSECQFYLYNTLKAIQYAHSHGIMHRDVKPLNILYDRKEKQLRLIDWGLADFYYPKQRYSIHVASRHYKAPELLLDYQVYDYSVDIWAFGATMAGMIFRRSPFFKGQDDEDMISKIAAVLGIDALNAYLYKYGIPPPKVLQHTIARGKPRPWTSFVNQSNASFATAEALDLLDKCLKYDHVDRITADEALQHPYFDSIRQAESQ